MAWGCYLFDATTGLVAQPVDIPNLKWSITVSDSSARTARDEGGDGAEEVDVSGLNMPWAAVPGETREAKIGAISSYRRGVLVEWDGVPVVAGIIGDRTDTWEDTDFEVYGPMQILESRYLGGVEYFGQAKGSKTKWTLAYRDKSLRGIAADLVNRSTNLKEGGYLPIDLPYIGEDGTHDRTYYGYNVQNNACQKLLDEIASVEGGPDIQFRPYRSDETHVRWRMIAGSDSEPALTGGSPTPMLQVFPGGGSAFNVKVAWQGPVMRVWGTGAGQDEGTLCYLADDLTLCERDDPMVLMETTASSSDWDNAKLVMSHTKSTLDEQKAALCQIACDVSANDPSHAVKPGMVWPGQRVDMYVEGYPSLPDGVYALRLMEMSGDLGDTVSLVFDPIDDPWEWGIPR